MPQSILKCLLTLIIEMYIELALILSCACSLCVCMYTSISTCICSNAQCMRWKWKWKFIICKWKFIGGLPSNNEFRKIVEYKTLTHRHMQHKAVKYLWENEEESTIYGAADKNQTGNKRYVEYNAYYYHTSNFMFSALHILFSMPFILSRALSALQAHTRELVKPFVHLSNSLFSFDVENVATNTNHIHSQLI